MFSPIMLKNLGLSLWGFTACIFLKKVNCVFLNIKLWLKSYSDISQNIKFQYNVQ